MTTAQTHRANWLRGPVNAVFFSVFDGYLDRHLHEPKQRLFADLPDEVVELGPGVGANFRYLSPGTTVIAVEPNPAMHQRLRARADRHDITLELHPSGAEQLDLPDGSAEAVVSSLVLCTVPDPRQVMAEVLRVLRPGGRFVFVEHVGAPEGTALRRVQHAVRRPWAWCLEGCDCERDLEAVVEGSGFADVRVERHRMRTAFVPANPVVAGVATKAR